MMRFVWLLVLLFGTKSLAQNFTPEEKQLILSGDKAKKMKVYQVTNEKEHQVLLSQSQEINPKDPLLPVLIERMHQSVLDPDNQGVGIAAPQVGINRKVIWVQRFDKEGQPFECFINPKILWRSKIQILGPEGDLSIPDFRDNFYRSEAIQLEYFNLNGEKKTEMVEGFTAVIFQHEIDHLFGILIEDKIKKQREENFSESKVYRQTTK